MIETLLLTPVIGGPTRVLAARAVGYDGEVTRSLSPAVVALVAFVGIGPAVASVACGSGGDDASASADGGATPTPTASSGDGASSDAIGPGASDADGAATADAAHAPHVVSTVITTAHRFIDGQMFGGWGPHLGHLLRRATPDELWFADDACSQAGGTDGCDVLVDRRIDYFRMASDGSTASKIAELALPAGIQQNTASLLAGNTIFTYGVDVNQSKLVECTLDLSTTAKACTTLPFALGANANYIGAALSPDGAKVVWLTNVKDGGGGQFQYFVDYGAGWNGPRLGDAAGYNDASYINVAFGGGAHKSEMLMHVQLVSGLAPAWTFLGAVGVADLATTNAATWSNALAAPAANDPIISTNDVAIDPLTNDAHLVARTYKGNAVYYHRPLGGSWSAPLATFPSSYRARLVLTDDGTLHLLHGPSGKGLAYRSSPRASRVAGQPVAWASIADTFVPLPAGYESLYAIYPEASVYETSPVRALRAALVGSVRQNEALLVSIDP